MRSLWNIISSFLTENENLFLVTFEVIFLKNKELKSKSFKFKRNEFNDGRQTEINFGFFENLYNKIIFTLIFEKL